METHAVLICDDNESIHSSLIPYLKTEGFSVLSAYNGETALRLLPQADVIILDVMLPGIDGFEVCREIRKHSDVYIIMLSARSEEVDRVVGLELGADDTSPSLSLPGRSRFGSKRPSGACIRNRSQSD